MSKKPKYPIRETWKWKPSFFRHLAKHLPKDAPVNVKFVFEKIKEGLSKNPDTHLILVRWHEMVKTLRVSIIFKKKGRA